MFPFFISEIAYTPSKSTLNITRRIKKGTVFILCTLIDSYKEIEHIFFSIQVYFTKKRNTHRKKNEQESQDMMHIKSRKQKDNAYIYI